MAHRLLDDFKKYAELAVDELDKDDKISLALSASEDLIKSKYNIHIAEATKIEISDGDGTASIYTNYAITALSSITLNENVEDITNYSARGNVVRSKSSTFAEGYDNVTVTYTTGYADADIPSSLKMALFKLADKFYRDADEARDGVSGFSTNTKTGIQYEVQHLPTSFTALIQPYVIMFL